MHEKFLLPSLLIAASLVAGCSLKQSQTGAAFVRGLQGYDKRYLKVVSTPKHFTANNEEHNRFECNADIPEKMMREYFLPAFEACITEGHAQSIMAAYNKINGLPCSCNHWLLTDLIRGEWGFDGYVVSDCGGVGNLYYTHKYAKDRKEAAALALKAGLDLECGDDIYIEPLQEAYDEGLVSIEDIDLAVRRILTARMRLGMFDNPEHNPYAQIPESVIGCQKHQDLALKSARESIVLLKNDGILPLDKNTEKIAVLGINAEKCELGDYSGVPAILPVCNMSARWSGKIVADVAGRYGFNLDINGGSAKVYIDGKHVLGRGCPSECGLDFKYSSLKPEIMVGSSSSDIRLQQ